MSPHSTLRQQDLQQATSILDGALSQASESFSQLPPRDFSNSAYKTSRKLIDRIGKHINAAGRASEKSRLDLALAHLGVASLLRADAENAISDARWHMGADAVDADQLMAVLISDDTDVAYKADGDAVTTVDLDTLHDIKQRLTDPHCRITDKLSTQELTTRLILSSQVLLDRTNALLKAWWKNPDSIWPADGPGRFDTTLSNLQYLARWTSTALSRKVDLANIRIGLDNGEKKSRKSSPITLADYLRKVKTYMARQVGDGHAKNRNVGSRLRSDRPQSSDVSWQDVVYGGGTTERSAREKDISKVLSDLDQSLQNTIAWGRLLEAASGNTTGEDSLGP